MPLSAELPAPKSSTAASIAMLQAVLDDATYEAVAERFGITRTAVERRIKAIALQLSRQGAIPGLNAEAAGFVRRLRQHREEILAALADFTLAAPATRAARLVGADEIAQAARRIQARSPWPWHDLALFYLLFATGARPLEIARLEVRDYLAADGSVRRHSQLRAETAITGKARPLFFVSAHLDAALDHYFDERRRRSLGLGDPGAYRGLDPGSRLFVSPQGEGFRIAPYGEPGQRRFLCRHILETYRKLFRYGGLSGVTPLSVRRTVAARLYERGADEEQVGLVLGISERSAVRELLPRPKPELAELLEHLV